MNGETAWPVVPLACGFFIALINVPAIGSIAG